MVSLFPNWMPCQISRLSKVCPGNTGGDTCDSITVDAARQYRTIPPAIFRERLITAPVQAPDSTSVDDEDIFISALDAVSGKLCSGQSVWAAAIVT